MTHALKTESIFFNEILTGKKSFEIRKFDRPFKVGDTLLLQEYTGEAYTGQEMSLTITHVAEGENWVKMGLKKGFAILSFKKDKNPFACDAPKAQQNIQNDLITKIMIATNHADNGDNAPKVEPPIVDVPELNFDQQPGQNVSAVPPPPNF